MAMTRTTTAGWMHAKVCPCCGYRGREIQHAPDPETCPLECPTCGEDLYARPPLSYAQREGLTATPTLATPAASSSLPPALARPALARLLIAAARLIRGLFPRRPR
jgi:hypothetical protein